MKGKIKVICIGCNQEKLVYKSRAENYKFCSRECMSKVYSKIKFNLDQKINNWKVIEDKIVRKFGRSYVKVQCTCGSNIISEIPIKHITSKKHKGCEKCSRFHTSKGVGLLSGEYWSLIVNGAKKRNLSFNITMEQAWNLYNKQDKKCALSGLEIIFEPNCVHNKNVDYRRKRTASLDRIDSKLGYELTNIQWLHKDVNLMKNHFNESYFKKICELICKKN
jgi:hypothetical protein